ncbi:uncharacterized protein LOC107361717 [Tetranychus urticae]|uniref:uncharacterized protein LOC107361717 n=1 Tax=Tetranychus urticae TaxID=32264 RepID=UPI00077BACF6|nr:uncharacterized protein LOC107361717 [Tetranychus urticae]
MIANSSPPRSTPLTPFNSSPFSRGSRAVHQGLKKAKAVINTGKDEADIDMGSLSSKDDINGGNEGNADKQTKPESPTSSSCDANLTPSSRGILKRRREAEMDCDEAVSCSKKKVIFASPISVSKIIDNVLAAKGHKTIRRRKLRYEDSADETSDSKEAPTGPIVEPVLEKIPETETLALNGAIHENSENSEPDNNVKQMQPVTRRMRSSTRVGVKTPSNPQSDSQVEKLETNAKDTQAEGNIPKSSDIKVNVKSNPEVISQDANDTEESDIIFKNIESLLMKMESSSSSSSDTPSSVGYFKEKFVSLNSIPDPKPVQNTDNDLPKKGNKISCLLTPSNFEFDLNCIPRLDPSQIIPKASIVIKRLTEELINRLLGKERNQEKATNQRNKQDYLKLIVVSGSNRKQKRN